MRPPSHSHQGFDLEVLEPRLLLSADGLGAVGLPQANHHLAPLQSVIAASVQPIATVAAEGGHDDLFGVADEALSAPTNAEVAAAQTTANASSAAAAANAAAPAIVAAAATTAAVAVTDGTGATTQTTPATAAQTLGATAVSGQRSTLSDQLTTTLKSGNGPPTSAQLAATQQDQTTNPVSTDTPARARASSVMTEGSGSTTLTTAADSATYTSDHTFTSTDTTAIAISGTGAGQYDTITVGGTATLGGTLAITVASNATLNVGDTLTILTGASVTGKFDAATGLAGFGDGSRYFTLVQDGSSVKLVVTQFPGPGFSFVPNAGQSANDLGEFLNSSYFPSMQTATVTGGFGMGDGVAARGTFTFASSTLTGVDLATGFGQPVSQFSDTVISPDLKTALTNLGVTADGTAINGVSMNAITVSGTALDAFIGESGIDLSTSFSGQSATGFLLQNTTFGAVMMTPTWSASAAVPPMSFGAAKATTSSVSAMGMGGLMTFTADSATLQVNAGTKFAPSLNQTVVDFGKSFETTVGADNGSYTAGSLQLAYAGSPQLHVGLTDATATLLDVLTVHGDFAFDIGAQKTVNVQTNVPANLTQVSGYYDNTLAPFVTAGLTASSDYSTLSGLAVNTYTLSATNVSGFMGLGDPTFDPTTHAIANGSDLTGFGFSNLSFDLGVFTPASGAIRALGMPDFMALKGHVASADTYGLTDVLQLNASDITIAINKSILLKGFNVPSIPNFTLPTIQLPDLLLPDLSLPSVSLPQLGLPSINLPDFNITGFSLPTITLPSLQIPSITLPAITLPSIDLSKLIPTITLPSLTLPAIKLPTLQLPTIDLSALKALLPNPSLPSLTLPSLTLPDLVIPAINIPDLIPTLDLSLAVPRIVFPTITLPSIQLPSIQLPDLDLSAFGLPKLKLPALTLPSITIPSFTLPSINLPNLDITAPDFLNWKLLHPDLHLPTIKMPALSLPSLKLPQLSLPNLDLSAFHLDDLLFPDLSGITLPSLTLPSLTLPTINFPSLKFPNIDLSGIGLPSLSIPAFSLPDFSLPQVTLPNLALPNLYVPNWDLLHFKLPSISLPDLTLPSIQLPTLTLPKFDITFPQMPTIQLPDLTLPSITLPSLTLPSITLPTIDLSGLKIPNLPNITFPTLTLPNLQLPSITLPTLQLPSLKLPDINVPSLASLAGITLTKNGDPAINFQSSFGNNGLTVGSSAMDFDGNTRITLNVGQVDMRVADALSLSGSVAFEFGPRVLVNVATGLPANLGIAAGIVQPVLNNLGTEAGLSISSDLSTITGLEVQTMTVGASNLSGFLGYGNPDLSKSLSGQDLVGFGFQNVKLALGVFKPTLPIKQLPKFTALTATADSLSTYGMDGIADISGQGISIQVNTGTKWPAGLGAPTIDFASSFPANGATPAGFAVRMPNGAAPMYLNFAGGQRTSLGIDSATINLANFVVLKGGIHVEMGPTYIVNVATGIPQTLGVALGALGLDSLANQLTSTAGITIGPNFSSINGLEVNSMTISGTNVDAFVGTGSYDFSQPLDNQDVFGFKLTGLTFGMGIFKPTLPIPNLPKFTALTAHADSFQFKAGASNIISLTGRDLTLNVNTGTPWPGGIGTPVINFQSSFETAPGANDGQFAVPTNGAPIMLGFDGNKRIGVRVGSATIALADFVYLSGAFDFELGPVIEAPLVAGLAGDSVSSLVPAAYGGTGNKEIQTVTMGGTGITAFVGLNGPYWQDANNNGIIDRDANGNIVAAETNSHAVGLEIDNVTFGLFFGKPTNPLDPVRYAALSASAQTVQLVGISGVTASANGIQIAVNLSTPTASIFPVLPVVDFAGLPGGMLSIATGAKDANGNDITVNLAMSTALIHAQGFVTLNLYNSLYLNGSIAFDLGPTATVTLSDGSTKNVTTMSIGMAHVNAFIGANGPYWTDANHDKQVQTSELSSTAVGFSITDFTAGMLVMVSTNPSDLGAYLALKASVNSFGLVNMPAGITASGTFDIALNVGTSLTSAVNFLTSFPATTTPSKPAGYLVNTGDPTSPVLLDFTAPEVNFQLSGTLAVTDVFSLSGTFLFDLTTGALKVFADANLTFGPSGDFFHLHALGVMVLTSGGIAADVDVTMTLGAGLQGIVGSNLSAEVILNTTGADQTITIPTKYVSRLNAATQARLLTDANGNKYYVVTGGAPRLDGTHAPAGTYLVVKFSGTLTIATFDFAGSFSMVADPQQFQISANTTLDLKMNGTSIFRFTVIGDFFVNNAGVIAAGINVNLAAGFTMPSFGFTWNVNFRLQFNTGSSTINLPGEGSVDPGFEVVASGTMSIRVITLSGSFTLTFAPDHFTVGISATTSIFGVSLGVSGSAGLYYDANPGLAFSIRLTLGGGPNVQLSPVSGFSITGNFELQINTSGAARTDVSTGAVIPAQSFLIGVTNVTVNLFGLDLTGSLTIQISSTGLSIPNFSMSLNFFNVITLTVSGYFHEDHSFLFTAGASVTFLNPDVFGFAGSISVTFSNSGFGGSLSGTFGAFGIKVSAGGSFYIENGLVKIDVYISLQITPEIHVHIWMPWPFDDIDFTIPALVISGDWSHTFGALTSAPAIPPPPELATNVNGALRLNLGTDAGYRGSNYPSQDESYNLTLIGPGTHQGQKIQVSALGYDQTYDDVTSIYAANTGSHNTYVAVADNITVPVSITSGSGSNHYIFGGGAATVHGGSNFDWVDAGPGVGKFYGGTGNSKVIDNFGNFAVEVDGYASYTVSNTNLRYADASGATHTITMGGTPGVKTVVLAGAANASYVVTDSWTQPSLSLIGAGSSSTVIGTTTNSYTLTDSTLTNGSGVVVSLSNIKVAQISGEQATNDNNTFDISGWTGTGQVNGFGGTDTVVASNDLNFTLSNTSLDRSGRGSMTLASVEVANLTGGTSANSFTVNSWSGTANLDGQGAADSYTVNLSGTGAGTTNVTDSSGTGDALTVNGTTAADAFTITNAQVAAGSETVNYSGLENLTVNGGDGADSFVIASNGITATVSGGNGNDTFTVNASAAALMLNGDAGDDTFTINASSAALALYGGADDDTFNIRALAADATLDTGAGTNVVNVGSVELPAVGNANAIAGKLTITGGGSDTLNVNDTGDGAANTGTLTDTRLTGLGMGDASHGIQYSSIETLNVSLGGGDDTFNVLSTNAGTLTTLNTGAGANTVNFGSAAPGTGGTVNAIAGKFVLNGQGTDTVNVDDTGDGTANTGTLTDSRLTGLGMGDSTKGIQYSAVETLNIYLGTGGNTFNVQSTNAGTLTNLSTGTGAASNVVNLGSLAPSTGGNVNAILGKLVVTGLSSADTINVDDTGDSAANSGTLTSTRLTGLGMGDTTKGLQYSAIETLNINLGTGGNTFNVQSTSGGTLTTLNTGAGTAANTINVGSVAPSTGGNVNAVAGKLIINGQSASDTLNVDDTADTAANTGLLTSTRLTGLGMAADDPNKGIEYHTIETLNVSLGSGGDNFTIQTTDTGVTVLNTLGGDDTIAIDATSGTTTVNAGDGNDMINVGSAATLTSNAGGTLATIQGALTINGGAGTNNVANLDTTADTASDVGTIASTLVSGLGLGAAGITYSGLAALNLNLGSGNDILTIASTHTGLTHVEGRNGDDQFFVENISGRTEILGQNGSDTVTVSNTVAGANTVNGIQALLVVSGGTDSGTDALIVSELNEAAALSVPGTLTSTLLTGLGMAAAGGINYTDFETLTITLGQGDDTFFIASTHTGTTTLDAGAGNDQIYIATISGDTYVRGGAGDDTIKVNVDGTGAERVINGATVNGVGALLDLDGQLGSDHYVVYLAGAPASATHPVSLINVHDTGGSGNGTNFLEIYGTDNANISDNFLIRRNFIALLPPPAPGGTPTAERVNYDGTLTAGVAIYGRAGNDYFALDDNSAPMTIDGGDGNDVFQIGQMFQSERVPGNVAGGDEVSTVHTTQGYLTPGVHFATTIYGGNGDDQFIIFSNEGPLALYGEDGDDSFVVRAFALYTSQAVDPNRAGTKVNAGAGADYVEYNINAPVSIDGGDGLDKVVVVGTEFSDHFVITSEGVYGAGQFVTLTGIESLEVDGGAGNDTFTVLSTPVGVVTHIYGGLGSDTINVAGQAGAVVSQDLQGHSGVISNLVVSGNVTWSDVPAQGVSVDVADNDAPGVVITQSGGSTLVAENSYGLGLNIDSYTVVLSAAPANGDVWITVAAPLSSLRDQQRGAHTVQVYTDAPNAAPDYQKPSSAIELHFTAANWNQPQTVYVKASPDGVPEGTRNLFIQNSVSSETTATGYAGVVLPNVPVTILDSDVPTVALIPIAGATANSMPIGTVNPLLEGNTALSSQSFLLLLTKAPAAGESVTVSLTGNGVAINGSSTLTFGAGGLDPSTPQVVTVRAIDDGVVQGMHNGSLTAAVTSTGGTYGATPAATYNLKIADTNSPGVLVLQTDGSTRVIEGSPASAGSPWNDSYSVVLTQAPAPGTGVSLQILAEPTPTTEAQLNALNQGAAGDPAVLATIVPQVSVSSNAPGATYQTINGKTYLVLTFTAANWSTPQAVNVAAIDDTTVEGTAIHAFAPSLQTLDGIQGPLIVDGGPDPTSNTAIPNPLMFIGESNPAEHVPLPNPNLSAIESDQVDTLSVFNNDAVGNQAGTLTSSRITGLGMGSDLTLDGQTFGGGITYGDIEDLGIYLGKGDDTFTVQSTHTGETLIDAGKGNDTIAVQTVLGHTTILGGAGDDHIALGNPAASGLTVDQMRALVTVDGGTGNDTITVNDTADTTANVGTLDTTSLTGLDMLQARVRTLQIQNALSGQFTLTVDGLTTSPINLTASSADVRAALLALNLPGVSDIVVNRADTTFTFGFLGDKTLASDALALSGNAGGLVSARAANGQTLPVQFTITNSVLNRIQAIAVPATGGTYNVAIGNGATFAVTAGDSAATVRDAIIAALNPTNADGGVGLKDVLVSQYGTTYEVVFQGLLSGTRGTNLTFAVAPRSAATADTFSINAIGGTFRLNFVGSAVQSEPFAWNASAADVQSALQGLLGSNAVTVTQSGSTYTVGFGGLKTAIAGVDDRNLVAPIAVADRMDGVNYFGTETLNVNLGQGSDVFNVRGTTATTNLNTGGGNDRVYVSSLASETLASAPTTDFLPGNLDRILGTLNLAFGDGRHLLMISDEAALAPAGTTANPVLITDQPVAGLGLPPSEITITGLTPAPAITYGATPAGNFADGITVWTGWGADNVLVNGTEQRGDGSLGSLRTVTTLNTGLGDDHVTVNLNNADGFFVLNTQGPENAYAGLVSDRDTVDASGSTRPLIIFGGQDADTIMDGQGNDIIFGDRGLVTYYNGTTPVAVFGNGGPGDRTDGVERPLGFVTTTFPGVGGDDNVNSGAGRDIVFGGFGNDTLTAAGAVGGDDILVGDNGQASFTAGVLTEADTTATNLGGNDTITAGKGMTIALGGVGNDTINASADASPDILIGDNGTAKFDPVSGRLLEIYSTAPADAGQDVLTTGDGSSVVIGGSFADRITTGAGNDLVVGDNGRAEFDPTTGLVTYVTTTAPDQPIGPGQVVNGVTYDDVISAGAGNNVVFGGSGGDLITTLGGIDTIVGDNGNATFDPDGVLRVIQTSDPTYGGNDRILAGTGADVVLAGSGNDYVDSGSVAAGDVSRDVVVGDNGHAEFDAAGNLSLIYTTDPAIGGNDTVLIGGGDNVALGGVGDDTITAGAGNDIIVGDNGSATFDPTAHTLVNVHTTDPWIGGADTIDAGDGNNIVIGGAASDTITTGAGDDIVLGDNGVVDYVVNDHNPADIDLIASTDFAIGAADTITTNGGNDIVIGGAGNDVIDAGNGNNIVFGDSAQITSATADAPNFGAQPLTLGLLQTLAPGIGGDDTITTGTGRDIIFGGTGADTIVANAGETATTPDADNIILGDDGYIDFTRAEREPTALGGDTDPSDIDVIASTDFTDGGADTITTGNGNDIIIGGQANDTINAGNGSNIVIGDSGIITAATENGDRFAGQPMTIGRIETTAFGIGGVDTINTGAGNDIILGGDAGDTINAGQGDNIVLGDDGVIDYVRQERDGVVPGADLNAGDIDLITSLSTTAAGGSDTITTGDGNDIIIGGRFADTINAGAGNNIVIGDSGIITATNQDTNRFGTLPITVGRIETTEFDDGGNDSITTLGGNDIILGGYGNDTINAGDGDNVVLGDDGAIDYVRAERDGAVPGADTNAADIDLITSLSTTAFGGADQITAGAGNDIVIGGRFGDTINAGDGNNIVIGDSGDITAANEDGHRFGAQAITVGLIETNTFTDGGDDSITTGSGNDVILGGYGNDTINGGNGDNVVLGDDGLIDFTRLDRTPPTSGADADASDIDLILSVSTTVGGGADTITTGSGNDIIIGGRYGDLIKAGDGNNIAIGDSAQITAVDENSPRSMAMMTVGRIETIAVTDGGNDEIRTGSGQDIVIGGAGSDRLDGGAGDDLIIGDQAILDRTGRVGNFTSPIYQTLSGTLLYDNYANLLVNGAPQVRPGGAPVWGDMTLTLTYHSFAVQAANDNSYGNDYIAGGAGDDMIFGGLGDDTIQGDGSIDVTVWAKRLPDGTLSVSPSVEATTDGNDYIEGNGGNDTIFGGLGQDNIVGGSSDFFGLTTHDQRPDGSDMIFGGAGTRIGREDAGDTSANGHANDADVIAGDNADIIRIVGINGVYGGAYLTFGYDNYGTLKIIPTGVKLLDYTPGGLDASPAAANDIGAADEIHGEGGNDTIYGELGNDVLFGDGQDDDIIGGTGADWISGGNGDDGILGDDGVIFTSRNGTAEPLYGIAAVPTGGLDDAISTPGNMQTATINVTGALKKTAILQPFMLTNSPTVAGVTPSNDIIFGGLGNDFIHGGAGDDAISGAEALPQYFANPYNPGNILRYGEVQAGAFAAYNPNNPMAKVYVDPNTQAWVAAGTPGAVEFILNFNASEADGNDVIFGDVGNDWIVGGPGNDHMYGGYGDDLINADGNQDTANGQNNVPDTATNDTDLAFGGAGMDRLIANSKDDRLIDWSGEFNSYIVPFAPFGEPTVTRAPTPQNMQFLYQLSASDGADPTRALKTGTDASRNGEPLGELGLVKQGDADWGNQQGAPTDPQPGNTTGGGGGGTATHGNPHG